MWPPIRPELVMTLPRTAADVLSGHVTLQVESIDRMYLNLYVPQLQRELGVVGFFKGHRGMPFASGAVMEPISRAFAASIHRFADEHGVELVAFRPGQRKDDLAQQSRTTVQVNYFYFYCVDSDFGPYAECPVMPR